MLYVKQRKGLYWASYRRISEYTRLEIGFATCEVLKILEGTEIAILSRAYDKLIAWTLLKLLQHFRGFRQIIKIMFLKIPIIALHSKTNETNGTKVIQTSSQNFLRVTINEIKLGKVISNK